MEQIGGLDVEEGEGERGIWDNFHISVLMDWVSDKAIQQDEEHSRKKKFMGKSDESFWICQV